VVEQLRSLLIWVLESAANWSIGKPVRTLSVCLSVCHILVICRRTMFPYSIPCSVSLFFYFHRRTGAQAVPWPLWPWPWHVLAFYGFCY